MSNIKHILSIMAAYAIEKLLRLNCWFWYDFLEPFPHIDSNDNVKAWEKRMLVKVTCALAVCALGVVGIICLAFGL